MIVSRIRLAEISTTALGRFVAKVRKLTSLSGSVDVLLTTSKEMKTLNRRFRDKNEPTDVLSFPAGQIKGLAGEIAISMEIARENARRLGHAPSEEIKILILHGMLHIAGYNHEDDHGEMFRKEEKLRKLLKLPLGLIQRSGPPPQRKAAGRISGSKR